MKEVIDPEVESWSEVELFSELERGFFVEAGEDSEALGRLPKIFGRKASEGLASELSDSRGAVMLESPISMLVFILD